MSRLRGTILVVDDHVSLAENLAEILADVGYQTAWADSAEAALQAIDRGGIAALITDYRLPGLNGAQLIAELRRRGIGIPAVVMSAHTDPETIGTAEIAGALEVFSKPVDMQHLMALVEHLGQGETAVLVVEDNKSLAENLTEALRGAGHDVLVGANLADALSHRTLPDVALVDYRLPDATGVDVAERLTARNPQIRIMFVSGHGEELGRQLRGPLSEAPRMEKPLDVSRLLAWVASAVSHGQTSRPNR